ncbi:MAG: hypothetical protein FJ146_01510 [Deltaproteobacteria bacterium]|nr:hypothetical protein [Deltaproteobacteria bacterium]
MPQLIKLFSLIAAVTVSVATPVSAATAEGSADCLEVAAAEFGEAVAAATRTLNKDTGRCARLPSIEVKQSCANEAFAQFEQRKTEAQAAHQASVAACLH